jgi:hypothetical protein
LSAKVDTVNADYAFLQHEAKLTRVTPTSVEPKDENRKIVMKVPAVEESGKYRIVLRVVVGDKEQDVRNATVELTGKDGSG